MFLSALLTIFLYNLLLATSSIVYTLVDLSLDSIYAFGLCFGSYV